MTFQFGKHCLGADSYQTTPLRLAVPKLSGAEPLCEMQIRQEKGTKIFEKGPQGSAIL